jgi:hypothetical protein
MLYDPNWPTAGRSMASRFVILEHDHPALHWDFMLESDGALRTWRLPNPPAAGNMSAEEIAEHRLAYLDYEGPVSGGRGAVKRWDCGAYRAASAGADALDLVIVGERLRATLKMNRADSAIWRLTWMIDSITMPAKSEPGPS